MAAILDDIINLCAEEFQEPQADGTKKPIFTIKLETSYKKAVSVPGDYVVKAWVLKREGRKIWITGQIVSPDRSEVFTERNALCIESKPTAARI
jgi:hypothetical protein